MSEAKVLSFETGVKEYRLNDACSVRFNPTDTFFAERVFNTFDILEKKREGYHEQAKKMADTREIFDFMRERDKELRELIDGVFGVPVCDATYEGVNIVTAMSGGFPVWVNLFFAVIDELDTAFAREQKLTNPRIQKYMAKYGKK